jgi:quercetin dioxygenase-like cupin family protein
MKRYRMRVVFVIGTVAALSVAGTVLATTQSGVTTTTLANQISFGVMDVNAQGPDGIWQLGLNTTAHSDGFVVDNKIDPGGTTGWHRHPGPSLIFVIHGTVTDYEGNDPTCTGRQYSAGQGFVDSGQGAHTLRNEGHEEAETVAVQLVPAGAPRRIDVTPAPGNCPF